MIKEINNIKAEIENYSGSSSEEIEIFRIKYVSKKSIVNDLFLQFKNMDSHEKKTIGKPLNELKTIAKNKLIQLSIKKDTNKNLSHDDIDLFLPPQNDTVGSLHPLRIIRNKIIKIFRDIGFTIESGPEIEDDWYNFTALNFPKNHPAREMQDTFFISKNPDKVLRTHTSNVQIRLMEKQKPPIRVIVPGKCYRNEATDSTHEWHFHQIEGLVVGKDISFSDLKGTLYELARRIFGP